MTTTRYDTHVEYRPTAEVSYRDADHSQHPSEPHECRCICSEKVALWCPEHGSQVPRERRTISIVTTTENWHPCEPPTSIPPLFDPASA